MLEHIFLRGHCAPANGMTPLNAEACADRNCDNVQGGPELVNGADKSILLVECNCPLAYIMSYRAVENGSVANPCTNRPVPCQICLSTTGTVRQYAWSYHYLDHMQSMHRGQKLTEEEVVSMPLIKRST